MRWLTLQFEAEGPLAEAISDALLELGAQSVTIEDALGDTVSEAPRYAEPGTNNAAPWLRNRITAVVDPDSGPEALIDAAARAAGLTAPPRFSVAQVEQEDWVRHARSEFSVSRAGKRLWIVPSWCTPPAEEDAIVIRLDPGLAFGTGSHPTTRLMLGWLERTLDARAAGPPRGAVRVLDYGCGSGILALAAAKLGAAEIVAIDRDAVALEACAANARMNALAIQIAMPHALPAGSYDLIVANILAQPLMDLAPLFAASTRAGARIALAGILAEQAADVIACYAADFNVCVERVSEGWALVAGQRR